jgi:hypothetical protein
MVNTGLYTVVQQYDPITGIWRNIGNGEHEGNVRYIYSDGVDYRLANQTGCLVGALLTNAGSGYTSAPTGYGFGRQLHLESCCRRRGLHDHHRHQRRHRHYHPQVQFSARPAGGVQATGYCTLTGSAVSSVTVTNQGAGYASAPTVVFINDPREGVNGVTTGYSAAATATLTGSGTVTAVLCLDHGQGNQATLPHPVFWWWRRLQRGGHRHHVLVDHRLRGGHRWHGSRGFGGADFCGKATSRPRRRLTPTPTSSLSWFVPAPPTSKLRSRRAASPPPRQVIIDGGVYTSSPTPLVLPTASVVTAAPVVTFTMGGQSDTSSSDAGLIDGIGQKQSPVLAVTPGAGLNFWTVMSLSQLLNDTSALLNDQNYTFISKPQLTRWVNTARKNAAKRTGCIRRLISGQSAFVRISGSRQRHSYGHAARSFALGFRQFKHAIPLSRQQRRLQHGLQQRLQRLAI